MPLDPHPPSHPQDSSEPECSFPRLKDRLLRMIKYNEPVAFDVILHSECRGIIDTSHRKYIELFQLILHLASQDRDMTFYLNSIMKDEAYTPYMFAAWTVHRPLLPLPYLRILKYHFKFPDGSIIYAVSLEYPPSSPEREFLADWLVELQKSTLKWPFTADSTSAPASPLKSKSFKANELSWSQFNNILGEETKDSSDDHNLTVETIKTDDPAPVTIDPLPTPPTPLNFGYIYGWVSRNGNAVVRNSNLAYSFFGHTVKLHDTFMGFASSQFNLEAYADSSHASKSFFDLNNNSKLSQQVRTKLGKNFAACRLINSAGSDSFELQAILKGDLTLVVLGALPSSGSYDYKYPAPSQSYDEFVRGPKELRSVTVPISSTDIVLFLPRSLFTDPENCIHPHDIPGAFHYTELGSFATSFVQFINFVHMKTSHRGLIAVGGYVHEKLDRRRRAVAV